MNAVATGFRANIYNWQVDASGGRVEDAVGPSQTDAHRVDENIVIVLSVEIHFAANRRYANAITIAADSGHNTTDQMAGLGMFRRAKA